MGNNQVNPNLTTAGQTTNVGQTANVGQTTNLGQAMNAGVTTAVQAPNMASRVVENVKDAAAATVETVARATQSAANAVAGTAGRVADRFDDDATPNQ